MERVVLALMAPVLEVEAEKVESVRALALKLGALKEAESPAEEVCVPLLQEQVESQRQVSSARAVFSWRCSRMRWRRSGFDLRSGLEGGAFAAEGVDSVGAGRTSILSEPLRVSAWEIAAALGRLDSVALGSRLFTAGRLSRGTDRRT